MQTFPPKQSNAPLFAISDENKMSIHEITKKRKKQKWKDDGGRASDYKLYTRKNLDVVLYIWNKILNTGNFWNNNKISYLQSTKFT